MITFKPVVLFHRKPKDGSYNVKIRVTFKGVSRFLPTTLYCTQADLTRTGKIKPGNTLSKGNVLCDQMRQTLADVSPFTLEEKDVDWVVQHIKTTMQGNNFRLDFFEWADKCIADKKQSTQREYKGAVRAFKDWVGHPLDINELTASMLKEFIEYSNSRNKMACNKGSGSLVESDKPHKEGMAQRQVMKLRNIYRLAQDRYNDEDSGKILIPRYPFSKVNLKTPPANGQHSISKEIIQDMIDLETNDVVIRRAVDMFLLSFLLMGANYADLYEAKQPRAGVWVYKRQKTKDRRSDQALMKVVIPVEARTIIYNNRATTKNSPYWLNLKEHFSSRIIMGTAINKGLRKYCIKKGIEPFTFYAARKTWATIARQIGIEKATIDECLCHVGDYRTADIYIEKDWSIINDANTKVIDQFQW